MEVAGAISCVGSPPGLRSTVDLKLGPDMTVTPAALAINLVIVISGSASGQNSVLQTYDPDVLRVAALQGMTQQKELRQLLIHLPSSQYGFRFRESVFYQGTKLRSPLRALVRDPRVGTAASDYLALIGEPDDLRFIIQHQPRSKRDFRPDRWAYGVACSLLDPTTDEEWSFLRSSALNTYKDGWAEAGAIQTLKLIASPRSRELLEETQKQNQSSARAIARALDYVRLQPAALSALTPEELADRVAQAIKIGKWEGNGEPRYSDGNDKALVNLQFSSGRDLLFYTATFYKIENIWRLRGVRETGQALMASPN
jgi:hypothetical protein